MNIWNCPADIPADFSCVATIGIFDGVHKGHRVIIDKVIDAARERSIASAVLTFDPHPATIHCPEADVRLIMPVQDRLNTLEAMGVDATWLATYDRELSLLTPDDFVRQYFVEALGARHIIVGEDVRFGLNNSGDLTTLSELGNQYNFTVESVADMCDDDGHRWSSTRVRQLLSEGDVLGAGRILGRAYRLRGEVQHGYKRGRDLGFPTANLPASDLGVVPADGVYAGWLIRTVPGTSSVEKLPAAISVGTNPQFNNTSVTVEAHVLGRADLNLYGEQVALDFVRHIRPMMAFDSVETLLERMDDDLLQTARILGVPPAYRVDPAKVTAK
ncbi:MAG: bifunctional riboflavin kinase/FAD synthetase [Actinomycetaceae bacterium]|nr:bifunctional riboflavin kinase/FAD synthetase [Actinomycetaceae bacterium]